MDTVTLHQILSWTGGHLAPGTRATPGKQFVDVSSDTRTVGPQSLFIALRGARFDGHDFLADAVRAGATGLVIDKQTKVQSDWQDQSEVTVIHVSDTLTALQAVAAGYRHTLPAPVIAITGSVGKTSTRNMVAACLSAIGPVCQTSANNNNEIGLPKTILTASQEDQAIILELGMRGRGEIDLLSRIASPDLAIITNIGLSHIERLGSQDEILKAKTEIINGLKPGGRLILNGDDVLLRNWIQTLTSDRDIHLSMITTSAEIADQLIRSGTHPVETVYLARQIETRPDGVSFSVRIERQSGESDPVDVALPVPGQHQVSNALFGLAVADSLGQDLTAAADGAARFEITGNRQRLFDAGPILLMDDSYNASPESMVAALRTLSSVAGSRRLVAALGGMLELGDFAPAAHRLVGQAAAESGFAWVLAVGPQASDVVAGYRTAAPARAGEDCPDQAAMIAALLAGLKPGDALLVKGSRGFQMELVTKAVETYFSAEQGGDTHV